MLALVVIICVAFVVYGHARRVATQREATLRAWKQATMRHDLSAFVRRERSGATRR